MIKPPTTHSTEDRYTQINLTASLANILGKSIHLENGHLDKFIATRKLQKAIRAKLGRVGQVVKFEIRRSKTTGNKLEYDTYDLQ